MLTKLTVVSISQCICMSSHYAEHKLIQCCLPIISRLTWKNKFNVIKSKKQNDISSKTWSNNFQDHFQVL